MSLTVTREHYLKRYCSRCNQPNEPIRTMFGFLTFNRCYLCSPHLLNGWGACGEYFAAVPKTVVSLHNRKKSILNILEFFRVTYDPVKLGSQVTSYLVELFEDDVIGNEEVYIPRSQTFKELEADFPNYEEEKVRKAKEVKPYMCSWYKKGFQRVKDRKLNTYSKKPDRAYLKMRGANWEALKNNQSRNQSVGKMRDEEIDAFVHKLGLA